MPLCVHTQEAFPLILLPVAGDLQVWGFSLEQGVWECRQTLARIFISGFDGDSEEPQYMRYRLLSFQCGDLNGDGLDDLMVRTTERGQVTFRLFEQTQLGLFNEEPALEFSEKQDYRVWHHSVDLNHDSAVDLVKGTWLREPWFIPATYSGKTFVEVYLAQEQGQIPDVPSQIFRKND